MNPYKKMLTCTNYLNQQVITLPYSYTFFSVTNTCTCVNFIILYIYTAIRACVYDGLDLIILSHIASYVAIYTTVHMSSFFLSTPEGIAIYSSYKE